ncbi:hypothetical protein C8R31_101392 [Nitrosospira sp. Nsp2]|nr:hypothetical protein C8R31_101392 [Nitrosospira sp. Nsp2]
MLHHEVLHVIKNELILRVTSILNPKMAYGIREVVLPSGGSV